MTTNVPAQLPRVIQILPTLSYGDAVGNDCLAIRDCLQEAGYGGDIYAEHTDPRLAEHGIRGIRHISDYHDDADILICHISDRWDYLTTLGGRPGRKLFIYHGITPPRFYKDHDSPALAERCEQGLAQLAALRLVPSLCLASSSYCRAGLERAGYLCPIHVLPPICRLGEQAAVRDRDDGFVNILSVGRLTPYRKQQDILEAFYRYHRDINPRSRLLLVGEDDGSYAAALESYLATIGLDGVSFVRQASDSEKEAAYRNADLFLCLSEHEGFCVPLLEAMQHGLPIIAYDSSSVAETLGGAGLQLQSKSPAVVAEAVDRVMTDGALRRTLAANGKERLADFDPARIRAALLGELEAFAGRWSKKKALYFDITVQRRSDAGTGIQRVEKEELKALRRADIPYRVIPFYFDREGKGLFECETGQEIAPAAGDIVYSADLCLDGTVANMARLDEMYMRGVQIWFMMYDLIPIRFPETCSDRQLRPFREWLTAAFRYTGIIGISKATTDDARAYLEEHPELRRNPNLRMEWAWIGCDFSGRRDMTAPKQAGSTDTTGPAGVSAPADMTDRPADSIPAPRTDGPVRLLMVSTVEPRKMYDQAVQAFDLLRKRGADVQLDIVGREGWKVQDTVALIESSPSYGSSLIWHRGGIGDEELVGLYEDADAIIFASKAEGFGLPIVEGAYYGKPLILRDMPVFREIAGDGAFYFSGYEPEDLACAIEDWLALFKAGKAPSSSGIHLTSWQEHCGKLLEILTGGEHA